MEHIKTIIFDLDDTLVDTSSQLKAKAHNDAFKKMERLGLTHSQQTVLELLKTSKLRGKEKFDTLAKQLEIPTFITDAGYTAYRTVDVQNLIPLPGAITLLRKLKKEYKLALITTGDSKTQQQKIDTLYIRDIFSTIIVCDADKTHAFATVLNKLSANPQNVLAVGDSLKSEIAVAKSLGIHTAHIGTDISIVTELPEILDKLNNAQQKREDGPKITLIGGGTGVPTLVTGLKPLTANIRAIITTTDEGRSSGSLRKDYDTLAPGDIRNSIVSLSNGEPIWKKVFSHRFQSGSLKGHTVGNVVMATLSQIHGDFDKAVTDTKRLLNVEGDVIPTTISNTQICAKLEDGSILTGEAEINTHKEIIRPKIIEPFLSKPAIANPRALSSIEESDIVIIGPGSLYTSIIPNLLVPGIANSLKNTKAHIVYVVNITEQPGQTHNYSAADHLREITNIIGHNVDTVLCNIENTKLDKESVPVKIDIESIRALGARPIQANLADTKSKNKQWSKMSFYKHDPTSTAAVIMSLFNEQ